MGFDYSVLNADARVEAQTAAFAIRGLLKQDVFAIGERLSATKQILPHGSFGEWVSQECGISEQSAYRYIRIADTLGRNYHGGNFDLRTLNLLASKHTPESVREEALAIALTGEPVTEDIVGEIKARHQGTLPGDEKKVIRRVFTHASFCSGIEGASVAFEGLGWTPLFFAEVDEFCGKILDRHYPTVPNLGDINKITVARIREVEEQTWTFSLPERPVKVSPSTTWNEKASATSAGSLPCSFSESLKQLSLDGSSGRTSPVFYPLNEGKPSLPLSGVWPTSGITVPGGFLTLNTSECPNDAGESSLSDIATTGTVPPSCYLSLDNRVSIAQRLVEHKGEVPENLVVLFGDGREMQPQSSQRASVLPCVLAKVEKG